MPKVSVIIPTYNSIAYLPDAVGSALGQTFTDLEIIIINDGSSDHTNEWVLQQSDPRLILISQENQGKSAARNAGIARARGEYLSFLDADDCWEPTKVEKQAHCLDSNPNIGLVYTWTALADENCQPTGRIIRSNAAGNIWKELVQRNILACGSTPMIRKDCFETVGEFAHDLLLAQDWDMWIRIADRYPFAVIKEPLVRYRQHPNNTSKHLQMMQRCNTLVLERAFQSASIGTNGQQNVGEVRGKAYYFLNLYLGWIAIRLEDHQRAFEFWKKACSSAPLMSLFPESIRLLISIFILKIFGKDINYKLRRFNQYLKR